MSGIYIHIPFCKKKCHYCDFYITTNKNNVGKLIEAIKFELILRKNFLNKNRIETIYFGGGTPSMIDPNYIGNIIKEIKNNFSVKTNLEITIEANPDDINLNNLMKWKKHGINRISLGIQTLNNNLLRFINRSHDKKTAISSIKKISEHYDNFSVDLIYGILNFLVAFIIISIIGLRLNTDPKQLLLILATLLFPFLINGMLIDWHFIPDQSKYLKDTIAFRSFDFGAIDHRPSIYIPSLILALTFV